MIAAHPLAAFVIAAFVAGAAMAELAEHLKWLGASSLLLTLCAANLLTGVLLGWWLL